MGIAMLLVLCLAWQPSTAVGAPVGQENPMSVAAQPSMPVAAPDETLRLTSATTLTLFAGSPNPSVFGQTVSWGYSLSIGGACVSPTGTISLREGTTVLDTKAIGIPLSYSGLSVGIHTTMNAVYNGDGSCDPDTSPNITQTVSKASTSVALASSGSPTSICDTIYFTATLAVTPPGGGSPGGSIAFKDGASTIGVEPVSGAGTYFFNTSTFGPGAHSITAVYSGDSNYTGSTSSPALSQTVNKGGTTTTLTKAPNPSKFGEYVVLTATVTSAASCGTPAGLVTFRDGAIPIGSGFLDGSGVATIAVCNLTVGSHPLMAHYGGDSSFSSSDSASSSQTVNKDDTMTSLSSSVNPSVFGQLITLSAAVVGVSPCTGTPQGTVTFKEGAMDLATISLSSGEASFLFNSLPVGSHSITAVYNGDAEHNASPASAVLTQVVNKDPTTTTLSSSTNPAVYGQTITLQASVTANAPGAGFPSGTVDFKDITGATTLCTGNGAGASCGVSNLPVGSRTLRADYSGDSNFLASNSATVTQVISKADTTTIIADAVNPTVFGQTTTFTATVSVVGPGAGSPTGTIQFKDGASSIGGPIAINGSFKAGFTTNSLTVGAHAITAVYNGDSNFNGSTSAVTTHTVNKANTTTTVSSSPNPSALGQLVTITATVAVNAPGSSTVISQTGTVTFKDGPTTIGTGALSGGVATMTKSDFSVGTHQLTAVYPGDSNFNGGTSAPYNHNVGVAATGTTLTQDSTTTVYGQAILFTATVTSTGGTPGGVVTFEDGGNAIGNGNLNGAGVATLSISTLAAGSHPSITAVYNGDAGHSSSTSAAVSHTVSKANTTTTVTSSVNPTVFGQSTTFTAQVNPVAPGSGTRTGTVDFKDGVSTIGSGAVNVAGQATFATSSLSVGAHAITAVYNGDSNFNTSTGSLPTQTVNKADTTTAVSSNNNPSSFASSVTFTANVTPVAPGAGTPGSGTVDFKDGVTTIGSGPVAGGVATFATSSLAVGNHNITAVYNGNASFNGSTSSILVQVVTAGVSIVDFSVVKTDSPDPVRAGDNVTYLISVTNNAGSAATATMTDTLPTQVTFVSFSAPGWACSTPAGKVVCSKSVAGGATDVITVIVNAPGTLAAGTVLINTATVAGGSGTTDANPNDNTATAQTTVYRTRRFAVIYD
jgi:hypothetical protein